MTALADKIVEDPQGNQYKLANPEQKPVIVQHLTNDYLYDYPTLEDAWKAEKFEQWVNDALYKKTEDQVKKEFLDTLKEYSVEENYGWAITLNLVVPA